MYPEYICVACERDLVQFDEVRERFRKVDEFWKIFLLNQTNVVESIKIEVDDDSPIINNDFEESSN